MKKYILLILLISFIYPRRDCLQETERYTLGRSSFRPLTQDSTLSPSGHFFIHYDTTSQNFGKPPDLTDNDGNDIPDYIDQVGIMADSAHHVLVDIMGYEPEPFDRDSIYDIYVISYGPNSYGHCVYDGNGISFVKIDNDYIGYDSNFGQTPLKIMQIALVHEYFHAIQYGYQHNTGSGPGSDEYFYEMTSMWIEDVIVPDGNDYLEDMWVGPFLDIPQGEFDNRWPQCSHPNNCDGEGYELALFGHYLSSYVDLDGSLDEKQSTIMKEIWTEYSDSYHSSNNYDKPLVVIDRILKNEFQSSFIEAWVDFISRNLYNGIDERFYYYSDQALIEPISTTFQTLSDDYSFELVLDDKSVAIQSFQLGESGLLGFYHRSDKYLGRFSIISTSDYNDLFWAADTSGIELTSGSDIHFVYGSETKGSVSIDITYNPSCSILDGGSVWPGDTNADNIVDSNDIYPIAKYWSKNPPEAQICERSLVADSLYQWSGQPLLNNMFLDDNCISHADANGDGKVNIADILPIMINWGYERSNSGDSNEEEESCIVNTYTEDLSRYYSNFSKIYNSLTGNSNAEVQMRSRLEELFGFSSVPSYYQIYQNYPNPFNPIASIPYFLPQESIVILSIYNIMGQEVLTEGAFVNTAGYHEIEIDGTDLSSGVYFYQFIIDGHEFKPMKMVLLK